MDLHLDYEFVKNKFALQAVFLPSLKATCIYDMYREIVDHMYSGSRLSYDERQILVNELVERENTLTMYIGNGIAMPHIRATFCRDTSAMDRIGWFRSQVGVTTRFAHGHNIHTVLCIVGWDNLQAMCGVGLEILGSPIIQRWLDKVTTPGEMRLAVMEKISSMILGTTLVKNGHRGGETKTTLEILYYPEGLHMRPCMGLVDLCNRFECDITMTCVVSSEGPVNTHERVDAKNIMLASMAGAIGGRGGVSAYLFEAIGPDAESAIVEIGTFFEELNSGGLDYLRQCLL